MTQISDEEIRQHLRQILSTTDLTQTTRKKIRKQMETDLNLNLSTAHYKDLLKKEIAAYVVEKDSIHGHNNNNQNDNNDDTDGDNGINQQPMENPNPPPPAPPAPPVQPQQQPANDSYDRGSNNNNNNSGNNSSNRKTQRSFDDDDDEPSRKRQRLNNGRGRNNNNNNNYDRNNNERSNNNRNRSRSRNGGGRNNDRNNNGNNNDDFDVFGENDDNGGNNIDIDSRHSVIKKADDGSRDSYYIKVPKTLKRVVMHKFRGKTYIGFREYYQKGPDELPTKKGCNFSVEQWKYIQSILPQVQAKIEQMESRGGGGGRRYN